MKASATNNNGQRNSESHTPIDRAIAWLRDYAHAHPYTAGAEEARTIGNELRAVRNRPALDELLALLAQIAKTDQGLQEIHRAKTQIKQYKHGSGEET
jgi:hypothetical protein